MLLLPLLLLTAAPMPPLVTTPAAPTTTTTTTAGKTVVRAALQQLSADGVEPHVALVVTDSLLVELRKLSGMAVTSMDEVKALIALEAEKQLAGCDEASCLNEIAAALGVDLLVAGSVRTANGESVLTLRVIDQRDATATRIVSKRLTPAGGEEFLAALGPAVTELFPDLTPRKGQTLGVAPEVALRLNPPPLPPVVLWSTLAASGAAAAGAGACFVLSLAARQEAQDLLASSTSAPIAGAVLIEKTKVQNRWALGGGVLGGLSVVGLASAGVVALFTNFDPESDDAR